MTARRVWVSLVAVAVLTAALVAIRVSEHTNQAPLDSGHRVVLVSNAMPTPSVPGGPLHVKLVSGTAFHDQAGIVLSDDQCQPDGIGISHCFNRIRLASGTTITVRHPHDMTQVACLAPGEHVAVRMSS